MDNVATAREVLAYAQSMPENSVHREVILCRLTIGELMADSRVQLPIALHSRD